MLVCRRFGQVNQIPKKSRPWLVCVSAMLFLSAAARSGGGRTPEGGKYSSTVGASAGTSSTIPYHSCRPPNNHGTIQVSTTDTNWPMTAIMFYHSVNV